MSRGSAHAPAPSGAGVRESTRPYSAPRPFDVVRWSVHPAVSSTELGIRLASVSSESLHAAIADAEWHAVLPLVHDAWAALEVDGLTRPLQAYLDEQAHATAVRNRFRLEELHAIVEELHAAGIPSLTFKGPVLGALAYRADRLRYSVDIDLLIRPDDIAHTDALLRDQGYQRMNPDASPRRRRIRFWFQREHHYVRGGGTYNLDVHTAAVKPSMGFQASFDTLYARAQTVRIGRHHFMTPATEDLVLLLCFHGAKDRWVRLRRVCDLEGLIRRHPTLDWRDVRAQTRRQHAERIVALGLHVAAVVLGGTVPPTIQPLMERHPAMLRWGDRLAERLPRRSHGGDWGTRMERVRYPLAIQDTLQGKIRYATYAALGKLVSGI